MFASKKIFASVIASATVTGLLIGLFDVKCTAYVPCFLAPFMSNDKVVMAIVCMAAAVAMQTVLTVVCNLSDKKSGQV